MYIIDKFYANDLDSRFIESVKAQFKDKEIDIVVSECEDETEYLLKSPENKRRLLESIKNVEKGQNLHEINLDDFE